MFISLLHSVSSQIDDRCVANTKMAPAIEGKTLRFVQVLIRHGARAPQKAMTDPVHRGYWVCDSDTAAAGRVHAAPVNHYRRFHQILDQRLVDFLPNCRAGDLTVSGMAMHERLGKAFGDHLKNHKLISTLPVDPSEIFVRCTDVERTLRSAEAFIHGAFPPETPNEVIDILTDSSDGSVLRTNKDWCEELGKIWDELQDAPEWTEWMNTNWNKLKDAQILELLGLDPTNPTPDNLNYACDYIATTHCNDKRLFKEVTQQIISDVCLPVQSHFIYYFYNRSRMVPASYSVREMVRIANKAITEKKLKFSLLSAHDSTVAAVHTLLGLNGVEPTSIPPYASHLTMELWSDVENPEKPEDYTVRFDLNGEEIHLASLDGRTQVTYKEFLDAYNDINNHCTAAPLV